MLKVFCLNDILSLLAIYADTRKSSRRLHSALPALCCRDVTSNAHPLKLRNAVSNVCFRLHAHMAYFDLKLQSKFCGWQSKRSYPERDSSAFRRRSLKLPYLQQLLNSAKSLCVHEHTVFYGAAFRSFWSSSVHESLGGCRWDRAAHKPVQLM